MHLCFLHCFGLVWFGLFGLTQLYCLRSAVSVHHMWPVCTAHAPTTMTSCQHQGHNATAKRVLFCDNRQAQSVCGAWHPGSSANICSAILCSLVYILGSGPVAGSRDDRRSSCCTGCRRKLVQNCCSRLDVTYSNAVACWCSAAALRTVAQLLLCP
jgi:hypothetical protein